MLTVSTYVAPSAIEGLGVFAGEFIERRTSAVEPQPEVRHLHLARAKSMGLRRMCRTSSPATAIRTWKFQDS